MLGFCNKSNNEGRGVPEAVGGWKNGLDEFFWVKMLAKEVFLRNKSGMGKQ